MTIVQCPRCRDEVTVPARAQAKSLVRCPLCLEEYLVGEALDELPPMLEVLDGSDGGEEADLVPVGGSAHEAAFAVGGMGSEYRVAGGGFERALDASPAAGTSVARPGVKGARPKRKEKSIVWEMMKIVAGGLIGCILAPLVLWWGFGNDTLNIGPKVAPFAPWAVPDKFHGKPANSELDSADVTATLPTSKGTATASPVAKGGNETASGKGGLVAELPTDLPYPDPTKFDPARVADDPLNIAGGLGGGTFDPNPKSVKPAKTTKPGKKAKSKPVEPEPPASEPMRTSEPALPIDPPAVAEKPLPSAADFAKAVLSAADAYDKVNQSGDELPEVRRELYTDMYEAASEVGRVVTYLSTSDSDLIQQVSALQTFLAALASQPGKVSALKALTDMQAPGRKHDEGVLIAAAAQDFQSAGSMFELTTLAGKTATETPVICANNPQDFCAPGDELLIVGRVVENPKKHIPGYEGDRQRVVLYGYSVKVPKAETPPPP
jgi:hypothetical protein